MNHTFHAFSIFTLLILLAPTSFADDAKPAVVFSAQEQQQHLEKMQGMTPAEKIEYRNQQYKMLREKAASIGYDMPASPPWKEQENRAVIAEKKAVTARKMPRSSISLMPERRESRHQVQLDKYRKAAAEKRQAMQERLEKQRLAVQERIARLVEKNAIKPAIQAPPAPMVAPYPPMAPAYPRFYQVPPPMPPYYRY